MFHWICPECGREIPPSMRECQACDPSAAAIDTQPPVVEPIESIPVAPAPVAPAIAEAAPVAGLIPEPAPVVEALAPEPPRVAALQPVAEPRQVVEASPAPKLEPEPIKGEPHPVATQLLLARPVIEATQPLPVAVIATAPVPAVVAEQPLVELPTEAPAIETSPVANIAPEPVAEPAPAVEAIAEAAPAAVEAPEPVREPLPVALTVPVVETSPVSNIATEPAVEPATIVETIAKAVPPAVEATAPIANIAPESVVAPAPVIEAVAEAAIPVPVEVPEPVVEPLPVAVTGPAVEAAPAAEVAEVPAPVADLKPAAEAPARLQEEIDPFLALAEGIRAVQTARAEALAAPTQSAGILELAEAVGVQQQSQVSSPINPAPVAQFVERAAPERGPEREASPQETTVALLAPPEPEAAGLLDPDSEIVSPMLPFAPMQPYTAATSRSILPVPPRRQILAADSGPRITLPGPTLPPELSRLQDANVVTVIGEQTAQRAKEAIAPAKRGGAPGWLVSAGVMLVLLAAALAVVFYLYPRTVADAKPTPTPAEAATAVAPTGSSSPLSKFIEVTGFRIVVDSNKKSEVQYLVINHSAADISDVNVFITLRSVKPGQAPVCRFSFKVPSLGPFESKEMSSPIEKMPPTFSLPAWQDLRADVQISQ